MGPIFFLLFGFFLLAGGKPHFGYIYGLALLGSSILHVILSLMSPPLSSAEEAQAQDSRNHPAGFTGGSRHFSSTLTFTRSASTLFDQLGWHIGATGFAVWLHSRFCCNCLVYLYLERNILFGGKNDEYEAACGIPIGSVLHWFWSHEYLFESRDWKLGTKDERGLRNRKSERVECRLDTCCGHQQDRKACSSSGRNSQAKVEELGIG